MSEGRESSVRCFAVGEAAACLEVLSTKPAENQTRLLELAQRLRNSAAFTDVVPGWGNVTVLADPAHHTAERLQSLLLAAWHTPSRQAPLVRKERVLRVRYGGEHGPDLSAVAALAGMSESAVVQAHSAVVYTVAFLGFQPGFAYLMGLPASLHMPRRAEPRLRVPAGSVAIGGAQTGVYPSSSPGGWQIIGRTEQALFDASASTADAACWLQPGDRVRFVVEADGD